MCLLRPSATFSGHWRATLQLGRCRTSSSLATARRRRRRVIMAASVSDKCEAKFPTRRFRHLFAKCTTRCDDTRTIAMQRALDRCRSQYYVGSGYSRVRLGKTSEDKSSLSRRRKSRHHLKQVVKGLEVAVITGSKVTNFNLKAPLVETADSLDHGSNLRDQHGHGQLNNPHSFRPRRIVCGEDRRYDHWLDHVRTVRRPGAATPFDLSRREEVEWTC